MRTAVGVALVTVCLGLAGCSLFGKKQTAQNNHPKPFVGSEKPTKAEIAAMPRDSGGPLPGANGLIAGQVLVESTGRPVKAYILVKNLEDEDSKTAKLDVETNDAGYFTIPGLKVGGHYQLIARAKDGDKLISQIAWVQPPKPSLLLQLNEQRTTARTPPLPDAPTMPGKKSTTGKESSQERTSAVQIDPPIRLSEQEPPSRGGLAAPVPETGPGASSGDNPPNPANIAEGEFPRIRSSVPADIPNKPWPPPVPGRPQPQWQSEPGERPSPSAPAVPAPPGSVRLPNIPTPVPSCGLYGNRLDNFALHDLDGNVWEYRRHRRGRLMLLDFWYHTCGPCLHAIPYLVELQRDYGPYGLEVVSIACETGTLEEQRRNVRAIRGRYNINYTTLLSGGGPEHCPVMAQF
ncbi:MAG: hypothetical protein ACRELF_20745, partial [Gemmataceae bacterium]